jgi:peptide deformylase
MAIRDILLYPDPRLNIVAKPVAEVNDEIRTLVDDLAQTMYAAPGIGLAATQVDVHLRVIVIDASEARDQLVVLINPEIVAAEGEQQCDEGCLSVPGVYEPVTRASKVTVRALNREGEPFELTAEGMLAVCVQHEMDHLVGRVFVERLSRLKQSRIRARMTKREKRRNVA